MPSRRVSSTPDQWMPLWIGDTMREVAGASLEQRGLYLELIIYAWPHRGQIPNDDQKLAKIAGTTKSRITRNRPFFERFFFVETSDHRVLTHRRIAGMASKLWATYEKRATANPTGKAKETGDLFDASAKSAGKRTKPQGNPKGTPKGDPHGSPDGIPERGHIPEEKQKQEQEPAAPPPTWVPWEQCAELTKLGCPDAVPGHRSWGEARSAAPPVTVEELTALAKTEKGARKPLAYLVTTVLGMRADSARVNGQTPPTPSLLSAAIDPKLIRRNAARGAAERAIYDAIHQHEVAGAITEDERTQRIAQAKLLLQRTLIEIDQEGDHA